MQKKQTALGQQDESASAVIGNSWLNMQYLKTKSDSQKRPVGYGEAKANSTLTRMNVTAGEKH